MSPIGHRSSQTHVSIKNCLSRKRGNGRESRTNCRFNFCRSSRSCAADHRRRQGQMFPYVWDVAQSYRRSCYRPIADRCRSYGNQRRLPFARKIRLEWNARNRYRIFPMCRFAGPESLAARRKQWQIKMAAASAVSKGRKRGRSEPGLVGIYKWYRIFPVISAEDFYLFRKLSGGMSCIIWNFQPEFSVLLTNGKRSRLYNQSSEITFSD